MHSGSELRFQVKELLFDNAYHCNVVDDEKSWFTQMEVLDLIYYQFFSTANSLEHQPTSSQYFEALTQYTLAQAAAAINCVLSEYAREKKSRNMFSPDEYRSTFCPSPVIHFTPEATALINHTVVGHLIQPLRFNTIRIGAPQFPLALLSLDWCSSMWFGTQFPQVYLGWNCCCNSEFCTPVPSPPSRFGTSLPVMALLDSRLRSTA